MAILEMIQAVIVGAKVKMWSTILSKFSHVKMNKDTKFTCNKNGYIWICFL